MKRISRREFYKVERERLAQRVSELGALLNHERQTTEELERVMKRMQKSIERTFRDKDA